ncbi:MAG: hypothetical protein RLZ98_2878 [Pseudomonadota bacterium]|jgi:hypothetical protein
MRIPLAVLLAAMPLAAAEAQHTHRQHGAHEHGKGTLDIAYEGGKLQMELRAPADDIVGFEHAARTKAQKAAVAKAIARLSDPMQVLGFPKEAGCKATSAQAERHADTHKKEKGKGHGHAHGHEEVHAEFHATYVIECKAMAGLARLTLPYFKVFPRARRLEVNIVTGKGQWKENVGRGESVPLGDRL